MHTTDPLLERYQDLLTLYSLHRLRENAPIVQALPLTTLIRELEQRIFPACFEPQLEKTVSRAMTRIAQLDCQGTA